jgi:hypothetical protein
MDASGHEFIEDLLRFALLRTANKRVAVELAQRAVAESEAVAGQWRTRRHLFLWAARFVAERMESLPPSLPGAGDLSVDLDALMRMTPPRLRSAVSLHLAVELKPGEIGQVIQIRPRELRAALADVRQRLAMSGSSEAQVRQSLGTVVLSEEERRLLESTPALAGGRRFGAERALGVAAVCLGVFMCLGWVVWERWRESEPVQMRAQMQKLLEFSGASGSAGIEKFDGRAAETPDWLFLHGMEGVEVPENFASLRLASARVLVFNGGRMAQFTTEDPSGLLMVAPADSFGLGGERAGVGRTSFGDWSGAWTVTGPYAFFLAVKDAPEQLDQLLNPTAP